MYNIGELTGSLDCKVGQLPFFYSGLPYGVNYISSSLWDPVKEIF